MRRILAALVGAALVVLTSCGSPSPVLTSAECSQRCTELAGSDAAFCPKVCDATCNQRCADLARRAGNFASCPELCSQTCPELARTYAMNADLCGWIVENKPHPTYTPRSLEPTQR